MKKDTKTKKSSVIDQFNDEPNYRQIYARLPIPDGDEFMKNLEEQGLSIYKGITIAVRMFNEALRAERDKKL